MKKPRPRPIRPPEDYSTWSRAELEVALEDAEENCRLMVEYNKSRRASMLAQEAKLKLDVEAIEKALLPPAVEDQHTVSGYEEFLTK